MQLHPDHPKTVIPSRMHFALEKPENNLRNAEIAVSILQFIHSEIATLIDLLLDIAGFVLLLHRPAKQCAMTSGKISV